jgi:N-acetylglutamate synthase-like GNAT family acetyltransferase
MKTKRTKMEIIRADEKDAEEILALQKRAYKQEAEFYNNFSIQPLTMTIEETIKDFKKCIVLKAVEDGKIIGSARAYEASGTCYVGKLMVEPGMQNKGLGTQLMKEIEKCFIGIRRFELFTGYKSVKNIHLYEKLGYKKIREELIPGQVGCVYMEKQVVK